MFSPSRGIPALAPRASFHQIASGGCPFVGNPSLGYPALLAVPPVGIEPIMRHPRPLSRASFRWIALGGCPFVGNSSLGYPPPSCGILGPSLPSSHQIIPGGCSSVGNPGSSSIMGIPSLPLPLPSDNSERMIIRGKFLLGSPRYAGFRAIPSRPSAPGTSRWDFSITWHLRHPFIPPSHRIIPRWTPIRGNLSSAIPITWDPGPFPATPSHQIVLGGCSSVRNSSLPVGKNPIGKCRNSM